MTFRRMLNQSQAERLTTDAGVETITTITLTPPVTLSLAYSLGSGATLTIV